MRLIGIVLAARPWRAAGRCSAADFEVKILNKGAEGSTMFEPSFVQVQPGDIDSVPTDKATTSKHQGDVSRGRRAVQGQMNEAYDLTATAKVVLYRGGCPPPLWMWAWWRWSPWATRRGTSRRPEAVKNPKKGAGTASTRPSPRIRLAAGFYQPFSPRPCAGASRDRG